MVQSMPDASPTKWHRAHTTWFFETFVLSRFAPGYRPFDADFAYLFNSYYEAVGPRHPRPARGLLTRPTVVEVGRYRAHVDAAMAALLATAPAAAMPLVELGLHHEQQHQELLLTDIKHAFAQNPTDPAYVAAPPAPHAPHGDPAPGDLPPVDWIDVEGGIVGIGHGGDGFAFDNEGPWHRALVPDFRIASRPVTVGEYLAFVEDGGYRQPQHWMSEGWAILQARGWEAPAYWRRDGRAWSAFTLHGRRPCRRPSRSVTSAGTRPRPMPPGRAGGCRPNSSGRRQRPPSARPTSPSTSRGRIRGPSARASCRTSGNGRPAPTCPTPASGRPPAPSANTTASS